MNNSNFANTYYDNIKLLKKYKLNMKENDNKNDNKNKIKKLSKYLHSNNGILSNLKRFKRPLY